MNEERIQRMIDFLRSDKSRDRIFDINYFMKERTQNYLCGTSGCAWGMVPVIYPEVNFVIDDFFPRPINMYGSTNEIIAKFFVIDLKKSDEIFFPSYGLYLKNLRDITREDVADKLEKLLLNN